MRGLASLFGVSLVVAAFLLCAVSVSAESPEFCIVVSADHDATTADPALVRLLYLKELSEWPDGTPAKPIARPEESPAQQVFLNKVLNLEPWRLAEHWIALKQRNGKGRVRAIAKDGQVATLVKRYRGAFAVLPVAFAERDPDLQILFRLQ